MRNRQQEHAQRLEEQMLFLLVGGCHPFDSDGEVIYGVTIEEATAHARKYINHMERLDVADFLLENGFVRHDHVTNFEGRTCQIWSA